MKRAVGLALALLLLNFTDIFPQAIPQNRKVDWHLAGIKDRSFSEAKILNILSFDAVADGITPTTSAVNKAILSANGEAVIIYFPNGKYFFNELIQLPGKVILRGQSTDSTIFIFNLNTEDHLINVQGNASSIETLLVEDTYKNSGSVSVENHDHFLAGDFVKIFDDDSELITSEWAKNTTGQILQIDSISGEKLFFKSRFRRNFHISKGAKILKLNMAQNVGIENLKIIRQDKSISQTSNICFTYAANSWVKCVESENCNFVHVELTHSSNIEISGNYFHHAFNYGNGGKAYGVLIQYTSGENLVKDNIFNSLRHSMILQAGANGNVVSYNYSINPKWTEVMLPSNAAGDIVLHGNYVYSNLFEGNVVQNIVIDNSHGINGPNNTFFRNRAELYGIMMNTNAGNEQVWLGVLVFLFRFFISKV